MWPVASHLREYDRRPAFRCSCSMITDEYICCLSQSSIMLFLIIALHTPHITSLHTPYSLPYTFTMELAGAVFGIIGLGIQATECLIKYYASVKSSKANITSTIQQLKALATILQELQICFRTRKFQPHERDLLHSLESSIRECEDHIQELHNEAQKFSECSSTSSGSSSFFSRTFIRQLAYPLRGEFPLLDT